MPNLVMNPGFETGLVSWNSTNVSPADFNPYEGTATARLGSGPANLYQDVTLPVGTFAYQLSFAVEAPSSFDPGNLIVTVEWLNAASVVIGTGLSQFIPSSTIGHEFLWLTVIGATDLEAATSVSARIRFSKASGTGTDVLDIDQVIFTQLAS